MSASDACQVSTVLTDDEAVVVIAGEVDLLSRQALTSALLKAQGLRRNLVVDLSGTTFMDSSGLHAVVEAYREQRDTGGDFAVRSPSPAVLRLLEMAGLVDVLPITGCA